MGRATSISSACRPAAKSLGYTVTVAPSRSTAERESFCCSCGAVAAAECVPAAGNSITSTDVESATVLRSTTTAAASADHATSNITAAGSVAIAIPATVCTSSTTTTTIPAATTDESTFPTPTAC